MVSLILLFGLFVNPIFASFPGNLQEREQYHFKIPPGLGPQVEFWKKIYTQYSTHHAVIHDMQNLNVIYEVVYLGKRVLSSRARNRKVYPYIQKYKKILKKIARTKNKSKLSKEEKRVANLVGSNYRRAARNIRIQLGQMDRFKRGLKLSGRYMESIRKVFREVGVPEQLTALPHVESSFQLGAYSSAGAAGIWQFTRSTGRLFLKVGYTVDERLDPILSARAAAKLLKSNYKQVKSWPLAVTAYNHGINGMKRAKRKFGDNIGKIVRHYRSRTFGFASRNFYAEFLAALQVSSNPLKYFPKLRLDPPLRLAKVRLKDYMDVATLMQFLGMSRKEISTYNPSLRKPVVYGKKRIPKDFIFQAPADRFPNITSLYASIPGSFKHKKQVRSRWYTVQRGDTLSRIARRSGTTVRKIKYLNHIGRRNRIYRGQVLEMPGWSKTKAKVVKANVKKPKVEKYKISEDGTIQYRVRRNDNLTKISKRFNVPVSVLTHFNQMNNPNSLIPGDYVKIPRQVQSLVANNSNSKSNDNIQVAKLETPKEENKRTATKKVVKTPPAKTGKSEITITYSNTVHDPQFFNKNRPAFTPVKVFNKKKYKYPLGIIKVDFDETLSHIADWARISVRELRRLNKLRRRSSIRMNQTIKVPFRRVSAEDFDENRQEYHKAIQEDFYNNYRVEKVVIRNLKKGETLWELCNNQYVIPLWLLGNYNPEKNLHALTIGESIVIPVIADIKA